MQKFGLVSQFAGSLSLATPLCSGGNLKYCKYSVFLGISEYPNKLKVSRYSSKIPYLHKTNLHWSIDKHIYFMTTLMRNMVYFSHLLAVN